MIPRIVFKGKKLGSFFKVKDWVQDEHQSGLIYGFSDNFASDIGHIIVNKNKNKILKYIGETGVRYGARTHEHSVTDKKSAIYRYSQENKFIAKKENFRILEKGYKNKINRKYAESLYINEFKP